MSVITRVEVAKEQVLCGIEDLLEEIERIRENRDLPFAQKRIDIVERYAELINGEPAFRDSPAMRAYSFWIRKSAIQKLRVEFGARLPTNCIVVSRGIAFHLPPANVNTIFLYSWVLAFLTGNVNVTRLPTLMDPITKRALNLLIGVLREAGYGDLFITYAASENISREISRLADLRFVWGGDEKIKSFESIPLRVDGRALVFPDRYSYCLISGTYLAGLDSTDRDELARRLCNDVFVFNQMACSSPHMLYLVGTKEKHSTHVRELGVRIDQIAHTNGILIDPAHGIEKFTVALRLAAEGKARHCERISTETMMVELTGNDLPSVGGGFIGVSYIDALEDLIDRIQGRDQTLSYAGFDTEEMVTFARTAALHGLCRIVPIGQALNFDTVWDGHDLMQESVRLVRIL